MNLDPISNESVVNEVLKRITDSIIKQEIKPGEKLPTEVEFIEKLGVGRNSIREAIKMLCAMGVLEVKRGNGTYVATEVSPSIFNPLIFSMIIEQKSSDDLYELRIMFESMILYLVIDKASGQDIIKVEELLDNTKKQYEAGESSIDIFVQKDIEFHMILLQSIHNPLVERIGRTIIELFPNFIKKSLSQKNGIIRSIRNHYSILDVIKNKEKEKVFEIVEYSLTEWKTRWMDEIE